MAEMEKEFTWRIIGKSVRGQSHRRNGLPNQDAICWWPRAEESQRLVLSVSDGHGASECFRSHIGSRFAVKVAEAVSKSLVVENLKAPDISTVKSWSEENFPREIVRRWVDVVADGISKAPFRRDEMKAVEMKKGVEVRRKVATNPLIAYGATVLTVAMTEHYVVYLQLGDGDILVVSEEGEVIRPLPKDERLFANETTSLSLPHAWRDFKVGFKKVINWFPALILVSTDGYSNSFAEEKEFLKIGPDILDRLRSDGPDMVSANLESWLLDASRKGSGDDITLGIMCRP